MAYRNIFVLLLVAADCLAFDEPRRVIDDNIDGDDQLGYSIKTVKQESDREKTRQNAAGREGRNIEFTPPGEDLTGKMAVASLDPREGQQQDSSAERVKGGTAVPLFIMGPARQRCVDGYQIDENGICQKSLAPKGEKSFVFRRRKRAEQPQPKLSYADVVKFGRNRPYKAEMLTTTPGSVEAKPDGNAKVTTRKSMSSDGLGITTPVGVTGKAEAATTLPTTSQSNHPVAKVEGTQSTTSAVVSPSVRKDEPSARTVPTPKSSIGEATTTPHQTVKPEPVNGGVTSSTPVNKAGATVPAAPKPAASAPSPVPTKSSHHIIPTIISNRVKSILGDLNRAFLSGEKHSILSQSSGPSTPGGKSPDATRLRRWIHNRSEGLFRSDRNL